MKRKIFAVLFAIVCAICLFVVAGCSDGDNKQTGSNGGNSEQGGNTQKPDDGNKPENKLSVAGNTYYFYSASVSGTDSVTAKAMEEMLKKQMQGVSVEFAADGSFKLDTASGKWEQKDTTVTVTVNGANQYFTVISENSVTTSDTDNGVTTTLTFSTTANPSKPSKPTDCTHSEIWVSGYNGINHFYSCKKCGTEIKSEAHDFTASATDCALCDFHGCIYDMEVVSERYFKEKANCEHGEVYYKSCNCGRFYEYGGYTFEYGLPVHDLQHVSFVAATCYSEGNSEHWSCKKCKRYFSDKDGEIEINDKSSVILPLTQHSYTDEIEVSKATLKKYNVCTYCGMQEDADIRYTFTLNEDEESYTLTGMYGEDVTGRVYLPSYYKGKPVSATRGRYYGNGIFASGTGVNSVIIPETVRDIGEYSFLGCSGLAYINIPDSVTSIGSAAFRGCGLIEVVVPQTVTGFGGFIFTGCPLQSITLPVSERIGSIIGVGDLSSASTGIPETLKNIVLTGGEKIVRGTFDDCSNLESITLPRSITNIEYAFYGCKNLADVRFDGNIEDWCNITGLQNLINYCSDDLRVRFIGGQPIKMTIPETVTAIPDYAFKGFKDLEEVTISGSVKTIGQKAFANCTKLTAVTIYNGVTSIGVGAFFGCNSMTAIKLPFLGSTADEKDAANLGYLFVSSSNDYSFNDNVPETLKTVTLTGTTAIGVQAFRDCGNITAINLPDGVTTIGMGAFSGCSSLTGLSIPDSVTVIGNNAFFGCTNLEYEETDNAIYLGNKGNPYVALIKINKTDITEFTVDDNTKAVVQYVFDNCRNLETIAVSEINTSFVSRNGILYKKDLTEIVVVPKALKGNIEIPYGVTAIGNNAFEGRNEITGITVPDSVITIGNYAFTYCYSLTNINIPDSVTSIGEGAFMGCSSLESITVDADNQNYCSLDGILYNKEKTEFIFIPKGLSGEVTIPYGITEIPENAFCNCSELTEIIIPDSVVTIGDYAFAGCTRLQNIKIPDGVRSIGNQTFLDCNLVTSVIIPKSVTSIGERAFECISLESITVDADNSVYSSMSGILYNKDKTLLLFVPYAIKGNVVIADTVIEIVADIFCYRGKITGITIPDGITHIDKHAFEGCNNIVTAKLPAYAVSCIPKTSLKTVEITSGDTIVSEAFRNCTTLTDVTLPSELTVIGSRAFDGCTGLEGISIPENVTQIGEYAFNGCTGLLNITIPEGVSELSSFMFNGCSALSSIKLPQSLRVISGSAFSGCTGLSNIDIPYGVTEIGYETFEGCTGLNEIILPENLTFIGGSALARCTGIISITIPENVVEVGYCLFDGCENLTTVNWNATACMYGGIYYSPIFKNCAKLTTVNFGSNVTRLPDYAFYGCGNLENISLPENLEVIGQQTFADCSKMNQITIPNSVTEIGYNAFDGCSIKQATIPALAAKHIATTVLTKVTVSSGESIENSAFNGCTQLKEVKIGDSVKSIGNMAFFKCWSLTDIVIPDKVVSIGSQAFQSTGLKNVVIGSSVKTIGHQAFDGCTFTYLVIPDSVTDIESYAFQGCRNLISVVLGSGVVNMGQEVFRQCNRLVEVYNRSSLNITAGGGAEGDIGYNALNVYTSEGGSKLITDEDGFVVYDSDTVVTYLGEATQITIPNTVKTIYKQAFLQCQIIVSVTIPDSVTSIGSKAFESCQNLRDITIPASVKTIGAQAFFNDSPIENVYITDIAEWVAIEFVDDTSNPLIYAENLYVNNTLTNDLIIPDGVTQINDYAFKFFYALGSVEIPNSVKDIGNYAFYGCSRLTSITYNGSTDEWATVVKGTEWNKNAATSTVHCNNGNV